MRQSSYLGTRIKPRVGWYKAGDGPRCGACRLKRVLALVFSSWVTCAKLDTHVDLPKRKPWAGGCGLLVALPTCPLAFCCFRGRMDFSKRKQRAILSESINCVHGRLLGGVARNLGEMQRPWTHEVHRPSWLGNWLQRTENFSSYHFALQCIKCKVTSGPHREEN